MKLAKARVRARLGLPPEEEKPATEETLYDATDKKREKEEAAAKKKAKEEEKRERERQKHIRPWDREKLSSSRRSSESESDEEEEIDWKPRKEYRPMSQGRFFFDFQLSRDSLVIFADEWNEKQRAERKQEFAPMQQSFVRASEPYDPSRAEREEFEDNSPFYSTTKKPKAPVLKRRNASPEADTPTRGAAIPPPPTFEYFGPSTSKQFKPPPLANNLEESISAGLKFLREQVDKANKHKWTSLNEYSNNS